MGLFQFKAMLEALLEAKVPKEAVSHEPILLHIDRSTISTRQQKRPWPSMRAQVRRGKWTARIKVNNRTEHLGYFDDEEAAARAYDARAWQLGRATHFA
jgi:hypothetical protein